MIADALLCLTEEVNEYFRIKLKINEDKVILSGIVSQDGSVTAQGENKIILTLVNIEKEHFAQNNGLREDVKTTPYASRAMNINLYVLFSACFADGNYTEALRYLSFIIGYLNNKHVFTRSNTPGMADGIGKMIFEMENPGIERLNNIWATLGAKYMPSVLYKVRMLTFDDSVIREFRPSVAEISDHNALVK